MVFDGLIVSKCWKTLGSDGCGRRADGPCKEEELVAIETHDAFYVRTVGSIPYRLWVYADRVDAKLEDLAGTTLDDVTVDWRNGIVRITFLAGKQTEASAIRANDFTRVDIPRGGVGASRIVKTASRKGDTIEIVMDTGETLRIESKSFAVDVLGG